MLQRIGILVLLLGLTAFAPAPLPKPTRVKDSPLSVARVAGDWKVVSLWRYGRNGNIDYRIDAWKVIRIENGRWSFCRDGNNIQPATTYEIDIDAAVQPATINFRHPGQQRVHMSGIVRQKGGNLEVLYMPSATSRPTSFEAPPENFYLFTLTK